MIIILIESLHVFVNNNLGIDESFIKLLGFSICLIPFAFVKSFSNYINIKQTFNLFVFGFIGFTLITLNIYINDYGLGNYFTEIRRFGFMPNQVENEINGILINPNTIGKYAALIISVYLILFSYKKIKLNLLNITLLLYTMLIGFLTLSRTFLLLMFIILFIYMIVNFRMKNKFMNIFLLLSIFIGSLIIFMNDNLRQSIYNRVFETDDISGSRLLIYNQYIGIIREHANVLLIGTGMQDYSSKFTKYNDQIYQSAHNVFLEIISIWGIIGLATIILFTVFLVFESNIKKIRSNAKKTLILLPLLTILISAQFGQYFISYYHTFSVTIFSLLFLYSSEVIDE
ncbi:MULTISPECIES: O-antigen ligase family protein [unclassified Staphylococcus]|uniref:O-antigen ligase family protein n=1 Tax=unclassified Staphylococcus TaxID=91994 RepID=UPI0021D1CC6A|nr:MULTISPECIES: O-antigen ligase family protein [unclassified Staphylococcus]UXR76405.1 O-antigen ligase family protein [Staphylococcus sp. IVB6233]UXR80532.1 O-antigen ligase family protein [Staphylococcus sp. IVB6218]